MNGSINLNQLCPSQLFTDQDSVCDSSPRWLSQSATAAVYAEHEALSPALQACRKSALWALYVLEQDASNMALSESINTFNEAMALPELRVMPSWPHGDAR